MRSRIARTLLATAAAASLALLSGTALADDPVAPTARGVGVYEAITTAHPPDDTLRVRLQAGLGAAYGNARSFTFNIAGRFLIRRSEHQFTLEAGYNYGHAYNYPTTVTAGTTRDDATLADNFIVRPRYDLFFTPDNALFISGQLFRDFPGGTEYRVSGQAGYLRNLLREPDKRRLWIELGIDVSHERLVQPDTSGRNDREGLSARLFIGHTEHIAPIVDFDIGVEGLLNFLNLTPTVDLRINAIANLSARLTPSLSVGWNIAARYNSVPPPFFYAGPGDPNNIYRDTVDFTMLMTVVYQAAFDPPAALPPPAHATSTTPTPSASAPSASAPSATPSGA